MGSTLGARLNRLIDSMRDDGRLFDGLTLGDGVRAGFWDFSKDVPDAVRRQRLFVALVGAQHLLDIPETAAMTRKILGFSPDEPIDPATLKLRCEAMAAHHGFNEAELQRLETYLDRPPQRFHNTPGEGDR
ncbi:MAG: hypothetical protein U0790_09395 [Isosphaeraceae bacterium]